MGVVQRQRMSEEQEEAVSSEQTSKVLVQLLQALTEIKALEKQDTNTQGFLPQRQEEPHFIGTNQDFVFESDLHYGTYSGLRYGTVLDPYGMMAMLGFLVFLFYLIYNYLNATGSATSGRMSNLHTTNEAISELNMASDFWQKMENLHFKDL